MIKAILFDLDGTLCDCTELHYVSLNKALHQLSYEEISRLDHESTFNGLPTNKKLDMLISMNRIKAEDRKKIWQLKQDYTKESIKEILKPEPEKIQLHEYLKLQNIKSVCVTNSILETGQLILETTGQLQYMEFVIANDLIKNPKPHPEGYIRAMISLNVMPEHVLIVEDSPVGLQAANATGAHVWKIANSHEVNLLNIKKYLGAE